MPDHPTPSASAGPAPDTRQRRAQIVELVQREGHQRVTDLAARFAVSAVTIRSDLALLENEGRLVRAHGGADALPAANTLVTSLLRVDERAALHLEQKRRIGQAAASRVSPGDTVLLDAGTTSVEIARRLARVEPLTVVTNALNVALELGAAPAQRLILLGGAFHRESSSTVGPIAVQSLASLAVRTLFLGTQAFDAAHGLTDSTMEIAEAKRAMIRAASQVVLVTDSSKWGRTSLTRVAALDEIDVLITDDAFPADAREACARAGVELVIA
jgi:DeoR/GlpR family transcriptional regulator of sugar metabolism